MKTYLEGTGATGGPAHPALAYRGADGLQPSANPDTPKQRSRCAGRFRFRTPWTKPRRGEWPWRLQEGNSIATNLVDRYGARREKGGKAHGTEKRSPDGRGLPGLPQEVDGACAAWHVDPLLPPKNGPLSLSILDELICPGCGSRDQSEATGRINGHLWAELVYFGVFGKSLTKGRYGQSVLTVGQLRIRGDRHVEAREALVWYRKEVGSSPKDADLRVGYANVLRNGARLEEACRQYEEALNRVPDHAEALVNLTYITGILGERERSAAYLPRARAALKRSRVRKERVGMWREFLHEYEEMLASGKPILLLDLGEGNI